MALSALIIAESGSGKSTSIRSLNPKETFIINISSKSLPFKGWKTMYTNWSKDNPTGNMYLSSEAKMIEACMKYVNEKRPDIKVLVIDDLQYMSAFEFFNRSDEKGFEKFTQIGSNLARVAKLPKDFREDLTVFFLTHQDSIQDADGKIKYKAKTIGEKFCLYSSN